MLKEERKQVILNEVRVHNKILLLDIADILNVSVDTVRRDVKELHKEKKLKKVHGGAISFGFDNFKIERNEIYSLHEKSEIAKKAIKVLKKGQVILLSGGTTNMEIAHLLPPDLNMTCFTPSLQVANQLLAKNNVEIIFIGGKIAKTSQITFGATAINLLSDIKVDMCFLGAHSIDIDAGLTEFDWDIVQLKKSMIRASRKVIAPVISEKLNSVQRYKICGMDEIDMLITELDPNNEKLDPFHKKNITVL